MNRTLGDHTAMLAVLVALTWGAVARSADDEEPKPQDADIAKLVEQITENDGAVHRAATEKLLNIGEPAVAPLAKAAETEDEEVVTRCFDALGRLLVSDDEKTAKATQEALDTLSKSDIDIVGRRARTTLRLKEILRQREALIKKGPPQAPGIAVGRVTRMTSVENGKRTELERTADGSFTGKITETVDGKEKVTEIKAATEKELEEKFPDVHKAFQRQQQRQPQLGGFPGPGAFPGAVPPPGIQLNGQLRINGQFFGGGAGVTTKISVINGKRHIETQNGDEKIEIDDTNGKDIEVKHTRTVDGKSKTDEYKGADLDDLKKKHPEAAKLYEKYSGGNNVVLGGGGGAIQIQIGGAVPGRGGLVPVPGFQLDPVPEQPAGPRTIRAEQGGRKIEITDEDGKNIRVKLTKVVDGKNVSQEFSAEDLKTLKAEHPEAAKLYEQFTGRKSE
jgi:hypothetical protein